MTQKWKSWNTLTHQIDTKNSKPRDLLGGPVAKNPPCNAGDVGSILIQELRSYMLLNN